MPDCIVVAVGKSMATGRPFNIAIAFERKGTGRAVVDSSFHHFVDYNLDPSTGCPSFVTEPCSYRTPWIQPNVLSGAGLQKDSAVIGNPSR
jgi:hypothetical protein